MMTHPEKANRRTKATSHARLHGFRSAAEKFQLNPEYVAHFSGVPMVKPRARMRYSTYQVIAALQNRNGATLKAIADRFGVTHQAIDSVNKRCRQAGIPGVCTHRKA